MWRLEWNSNLRPSEHNAPNLPLSHHAHNLYLSRRLSATFTQYHFQNPLQKKSACQYYGLSLSSHNPYVPIKIMYNNKNSLQYQLAACTTSMQLLNILKHITHTFPIDIPPQRAMSLRQFCCCFTLKQGNFPGELPGDLPPEISSARSG